MEVKSPPSAVLVQRWKDITGYKPRRSQPQPGWKAADTPVPLSPSLLSFQKLSKLNKTHRGQTFYPDLGSGSHLTT